MNTPRIQRNLLAEIEAVCGRYLYHGGPGGSPYRADRSLRSFLRHGIVGTTSYRAVPTLYLVDSASGAFCYAGADGTDYPGPVFRVDVRTLDPAALRGDEWHLLPDPRYPAWNDAECEASSGHSSIWPLKFPADGFADPEDVLGSLRDVGQIAYLGSIPASLLGQISDPRLC